MKRKKWRLLSPQRGSVPWHRHVIGMGLLSLWFLSACNLEVPPKAVQSPPVVRASMSPTPTSSASQSPDSFPSQAASLPTALPSGIIIPSFQPTATPIPTVPPDPFAAYRHLETFDGRVFCLPLEEITPKARLRYPIDVAVSKDGNTIYVLNKRCDIPLYSSKFHSNLGQDCKSSYRSDNPIAKRAFIYTITKDKKIETVKVNGREPLSCQLGEDIEMDFKKNLYFNAPGLNRLYKMNTATFSLELSGEYKENVPNYDTFTYECQPGVQCYPTHLLMGPQDLQVQDSHIYFVLMSTTAGSPISGQIREWTGINTSVTWLANGWNYYTYLIQEQKHLFFTASNGIGKVSFPSNQGASFTNCLSSHQCLFTGGIQISAGNYRFEGESGFVDGPPTQSRFKRLIALRADADGHLYVIDLGNHAIRKVTPDGNVTTLAGNGQPGFKDGQGREAQFNYPTAIDLDEAGNLYVADTGNHAIRKITPDGLVTTFYAETNPN